jgi:hypothetical protein
VADDRALALSDEAEVRDEARRGADRLHEVRLVGAAERLFVHLTDRPMVGREFGSDHGEDHPVSFLQT